MENAINEKLCETTPTASNIRNVPRYNGFRQIEQGPSVINSWCLRPSTRLTLIENRFVRYERCVRSMPYATSSTERITTRSTPHAPQETATSFNQVVTRLKRKANTRAGQTMVIGLTPSDLTATTSFDADIRPYTLHAANRIVHGTANSNALGIRHDACHGRRSKSLPNCLLSDHDNNHHRSHPGQRDAEDLQQFDHDIPCDPFH